MLLDMKYAIAGLGLAGIIGVLVSFAPAVSASPIGCGIAVNPVIAPVGTFQTVSGTLVGNVSGSFSATTYVQSGSNVFTLTLPSGQQCMGVLFGR